MGKTDSLETKNESDRRRRTIKEYLNNLLFRLTGYQLSKRDMLPYAYREHLADFLEKHRSAIIGDVLDIGSAEWNYPKLTFSSERTRVTTLDLRPPADVIGDVTNLPFSADSFDCVLCLDTLEHVKDPAKALSEIWRVLRPEGTILASTPFAYELHGEEYGDYWRFTRQGWGLLLQDFSSVEVLHFGRNELSPMAYMVSAKKNKYH